MELLKNITSPLTIRGKVFKNRIIAAPVFSGTVMPDGKRDVNQVQDYIRKAEGGCAMVCVGETDVDDKYSSRADFPPIADYGDYSSKQFKGWKKFADEIHKGGALAFVELCHSGAGRWPSGPCKVLIPAPEPYGMDGSFPERGRYGIGPVSYYRPEDDVHIVAMTEELIEWTAEQFGKAALYMKKAGFDGVNVHCGHGWLIQQFLSPLTNRRADAYGGSLENRCRFPVMAVQKARETAGEDFLIEVRVSAEDGFPGGLSVEDTIAFCERIDPYVDIIQVSNGVTYARTLQSSTMYDAHFCNLYAAERIKPRVRAYVNVVGGINSAADSDRLIGEGKLDFIALARQLFADPDFANKCMAGRHGDINRCLRCGECGMGVGPSGPEDAALDTLSEAPPPQGPRGPAGPGGPGGPGGRSMAEMMAAMLDVESQKLCTVNPYRGRGFPFGRFEKAREPKRVLVIGGGMSGMQAAVTAFDRGHEVTLAEKTGVLGGIVTFADNDSFKYDLRNHKDLLVKRIGERDIRVLPGREADGELIWEVKPDVIICAVGSSPLKPPIPGIENALHATEAYHGAPVGNSVIMCGGGLVGCEAALNLAAQGKEVTIVEMLDKLASDAGGPGMGKTEVELMLDRYAVQSYTGMRCTKITGGSVTAVGKDGEERVFTADTVLYAFGMKANGETVEKLRALAGDIPFYPVGDCVKPRKVYSGTRKAATVALAI